MPDWVIVDTDVRIDAGRDIADAVLVSNRLSARRLWQLARSAKWN
jgi:hypothetical protein